MTTGEPAHRPVTSAVRGVFIVLCATTAALAAVMSDVVLSPDGPASRLHYPPMTWPLLLTLGIAGLVVMTHHRWTRAVGLLAAIVAAQVAGTGLIAVRNWFAVKGYGGSGSLTATPVTLAAVVVLVTAAATVSAAGLVWREPVNGRRSLVPARPLYVLAGAAVLVLLPRVWNAARETGDITGLQTMSALTYAVPWGAGIAAAGWVRGRSAPTVAATVTLAAVGCAVTLLATYALGGYSGPQVGE